MDNIRLKRLNITRASSYIDKSESLQGVVEFQGRLADTTITLSEDISRRIVALCADEIANSAREIAENIKADALAIPGTAQISVENEG